MLQTLGGSAQMGQVLDRVLQTMKITLKDVDYEPLASGPDMPRWKNAAQWVRWNSMVKEGLLRNDSPRESGRSATPACDSFVARAANQSLHLTGAAIRFSATPRSSGGPGR